MIGPNAFKALGRALEPKTPERAVFIGATAALVAAGVKRSKKVERVAKPLIMLSLQAGLWRTRHQRDRTENALLAVATTASLAGDVLMMEEEFATGETLSDMWIKRGASAFAVNHAAMIALALRKGARPRSQDLVQRLPGMLEGAAVLRLKRPHLFVPLGSYSKILTWMSTVMAAPQLVPPNAEGCDPRQGLELGGLLFVISDGTLLHRRVFLKGELPRAISEGVVLSTYALSQLLLVDGLAES